MRKILAMAAICAAGLSLGLSPAQAQPKPVAAAMPTTIAQGGEQVCLTCHGSDPKVTSILHTPMGLKGDRRTPMGQLGCQSCHGPSTDHITGKVLHPDIVFKGPNASPVAERNQICLDCHQSGLRMNWQGSQHQSNDIACTNCHSTHSRKDPVLEKTTQAQICFTCHKQQQAQSYRFSHHPINEGKVTCSDCHNPHGSPGPSQLKEFTVNDTSYNCHADKRGPMLREHPPVRENCMLCHTPHGSNQPRLLTERPPYLCQNCHDSSFHPGQPYSAQNLPGRSVILPGTSTPTITTRFQFIGRACLNCHSQVHGSNSPAADALR
jgi:DmsE family decaheme c-type cytochrome